MSAKRGMRLGTWWALLNSPVDLPVLFSRRQDAVENREPDEYMVRVIVMAYHAKDRVKPKRGRK